MATEELAKNEPQLPAYMQDDGPSGIEHIGGTDISFPFLAIGQGLTPAVTEGNITLGDIFNTVDLSVLAKLNQPLYFHPVLHWVNYIMWGDRDSNEGMLDVQGPGGEAERSVRMREKKPGGKPNEYLWTVYHNYVIIPDVNALDEWFVLGCCRSNLGPARRFNSMLRRRKAAIFSTRYRVNTVLTKKKGYSYYTYEFKWSEEGDGWVNEEDYNRLKEEHAKFREMQEAITAASPEPDMEEQVAEETAF